MMPPRADDPARVGYLKMCKGKLMRERDQQRARVYKAERVTLANMGKPLPSVSDVERYVKRVFAMKRVREAFPTMRANWLPSIGDGRGRRAACGWEGGIKIPLWARTEWVVVHELAHTITRRVYGCNVAGHGWQFCAVYLKLVLYAMGREAHDALKADFKKCRVKFTAPRAKRQLTDEQRQALADRLALGRLAAASARRQAAAA